MSSNTRVFRRPPGWAPAPNEATLISPASMLGVGAASGPIDAERLFIDRWPTLERGLELHRKQGVLVFAFDARASAVGQAWLAASLDRSRVAIVGRHSMCHLPLPPEHTAIALRHAAIFVRATSHREVKIRVVDLHTETAFTDESGRTLQAVSSEGSMFLRIGPVTLVLLVTGDDVELPKDPRDAYRCIPPRVFVDERLGTAGVPDRKPAPPPALERHVADITYVRSQYGAVAAAGALCKDDEAPVASLVVRSGGGSVRRPVGPSFLRRGFLVGRYARCDVGVTNDEHSRLSRVHLLVIDDGDEAIAVDTGSTNGTHVDGKPLTLCTLDEGTVLDLAEEVELTWHLVN